MQAYQAHSQLFNASRFSACNIEKLGMGLGTRLARHARPGQCKTWTLDIWTPDKAINDDRS